MLRGGGKSDADLIADARAYVTDSVKTDPPPEQLGLHPGAFTIDWANAKVIYQPGNTTVNVPIKAQNTYTGTFTNTLDSVSSTYTTAIFQRLVIVRDSKLARHGAYISSLIPDSINSTMNATKIGSMLYNGDLQTKFSGVVIYSLVGSNITVDVRRLNGGVRAGKVSLFEPTGAGYIADLYSMHHMLGAISINKNGNQMLKINVERSEFGNNGIHDWMLDSGGNPVYGHLDEVVVPGHKLPPGALGTGSNYNVTNTPGRINPYTPALNPPAIDGRGRNGGDGNDNIKFNAQQLAKFKNALNKLFAGNCGIQSLLDAFNGGFSGLSELEIIPLQSAWAKYVSDDSSGFCGIAFKDGSYSLVSSSNAILIAEVFHYLQDHIYPGGTNAYLNKPNGTLTPGSTNIEFEAHVLADLYVYEQGNLTKNNSALLTNMPDGSLTFKEYETFLDHIYQNNCPDLEWNTVMQTYHDNTDEKGEILDTLRPVMFEDYGKGPGGIGYNDC